MSWHRLLAALCMVTLLAACQDPIVVEPPPRVDTAPQFAAQDSTMRVPLAIPLDQLQAALQSRVPHELWSIDERREDCIPSQRVRALGINIGHTPDISCRIVGQVTRGRITLSGRGRDLLIRLPVNATLRAEDIGNVLRGETATGAANATLRARLSVTPDWRLHADIDLAYSWSREPGVDFLGHRIRFTGRADRELASIVTRLERELEAEFARVELRPFAANAWAKGFTVIPLNRDNPPAWMRVTPRALGVAGYRVERRQLLIDVALAARTETFVGDRPADPAATALPAMRSDMAAGGISLAIPVMAQYAQLEPVVLRELRRLNARGIALPGVGAVNVDVTQVSVYPTTGGRIAVGIWAKATPREGVATRYGPAEGQVWLTGLPVNEPDSAVIAIRDLAIFGDTDRPTVDLLARTFVDEQVRASVEAALVGNFTREYDRVLADARRAAANLSAEGVRLTASVDEVHHGPVQVTGAGLFLPVTAHGTGRLEASIAR